MIEPGAYDRLVRRGSWLAGAAGFAGAAIIMAFVIGGAPTDHAGWALLGGGIAGASLAMAVLWRWLVPRRGGFSLALALVAGLLAGLLGHAGAWFSFFLIAVIVAGPESLRDLARALSLTVVLTGLSVAVIGTVTLPVAVAAATTVAVWCRWQVARAPT